MSNLRDAFADFPPLIAKRSTPKGNMGASYLAAAWTRFHSCVPSACADERLRGTDV
jgi:hypothetical protein